MRCSDAQPPLSPRSVAVAWRYHPARLCSLPSARRRPGARDLGCGGPYATVYGMETVGPPRFLRDPFSGFALFLDPGRTDAPGLTVRRRGPRGDHGEGSCDSAISGLNGTASPHAVYASQWRVAAPPRKTRFRLLAKLFRTV